MKLTWIVGIWVLLMQAAIALADGYSDAPTRAKTKLKEASALATADSSKSRREEWKIYQEVLGEGPGFLIDDPEPGVERPLDDVVWERMRGLIERGRKSGDATVENLIRSGVSVVNSDKEVVTPAQALDSAKKNQLDPRALEADLTTV